MHFFSKKFAKHKELLYLCTKFNKKLGGFPALQNNIMKKLRKQTWGGSPEIENIRLDMGKG